MASNGLAIMALTAEAALLMDAPELLETMTVHLSEENVVLGLVRRRWLGDTHLSEAIEGALVVVGIQRLVILPLKAVCAWNGARYGLKPETRRSRRGFDVGRNLLEIGRQSEPGSRPFLNKAVTTAQGEALWPCRCTATFLEGGLPMRPSQSQGLCKLIRHALGHHFDAGRHVQRTQTRHAGFPSANGH